MAGTRPERGPSERRGGRVTGPQRPVFERGDVVFGTDPYKRGAGGRPWLVIANHPDRPFHGDQYIGLSLTTRSWIDGLIPIPESAWLRGGTPRQSRIAPWAVQSFSSDDIEFWQGRLEDHLVSDAIEVLVAEVSG